jgi:hypothetical protein
VYGGRCQELVDQQWWPDSLWRPDVFRLHKPYRRKTRDQNALLDFRKASDPPVDSSDKRENFVFDKIKDSNVGDVMMQVMYYLLTGDENADPVKLRAFLSQERKSVPIETVDKRSDTTVADFVHRPAVFASTKLKFIISVDASKMTRWQDCVQACNTGQSLYVHCLTPSGRYHNRYITQMLIASPNDLDYNREPTPNTSPAVAGEAAHVNRCTSRKCTKASYVLAIATVRYCSYCYRKIPLPQDTARKSIFATASRASVFKVLYSQFVAQHTAQTPETGVSQATMQAAPSELCADLQQAVD